MQLTKTEQAKQAVELSFPEIGEWVMVPFPRQRSSLPDDWENPVWIPGRRIPSAFHEVNITNYLILDTSRGVVGRPLSHCKPIIADPYETFHPQ